MRVRVLHGRFVDCLLVSCVTDLCQLGRNKYRCFHSLMHIPSNHIGHYNIIVIVLTLYVAIRTIGALLIDASFGIESFVGFLDEPILECHKECINNVLFSLLVGLKANLSEDAITDVFFIGGRSHIEIVVSLFDGVEDASDVVTLLYIVFALCLLLVEGV